MVGTRCAGIVVVDYGCPDHTAAWVEENYPQVTVVRVTDDDGFCLPRARNIGARHAKSPWIVFIDADVKIEAGWDDWVGSALRRGAFYRAGPVNGKINAETYGTFICERSAFERIGGYDEAFSGWGGEDSDMYKRLQAALMVRLGYPGMLVSAISHGDEDRTRYTNIKNILLHHIIHDIYMQVKSFFSALVMGGAPLSLDQRKRLMAAVTEKVSAWDRQGRPSGTTLRFERKTTRRMTGPYDVGTGAAISIAILDHKPADSLAT